MSLGKAYLLITGCLKICCICFHNCFTSGGIVIARDLPFVSRIFTFRYSISSKHLLADVFDTPNFSAAVDTVTFSHFSYIAVSISFCVRNEISSTGAISRSPEFESRQPMNGKYICLSFSTKGIPSSISFSFI